MIAVVQGDLYRKAKRDDEYPKRIIDLKPLKYSVSWFSSASLLFFYLCCTLHGNFELSAWLPGWRIKKILLLLYLKYLPLADKDDWRRNVLKPFL